MTDSNNHTVPLQNGYHHDTRMDNGFAETETEAPHLESVHRLTKIPLVESTLSVASSLYGRVKASNCLIDWTLSTAENTVTGVVNHVTPHVTSHLEGPIRRVDAMLCCGMDYVEAKVPAVKMPTAELAESTRQFMSMSLRPAISTVTSLAELSAAKVSELLRRNGPGGVCCDQPCCYGKAKGQRCCVHTDSTAVRQCVMPLHGVKICSSCRARSSGVHRKKSSSELCLESTIAEPIGQDSEDPDGVL